MSYKNKEDRAKYDKQYAKTYKKRIHLDVHINYYNDIIAPIPELTGLPINTFIKKAIAEKILRDDLDLPIDDYKP